MCYPLWIVQKYLNKRVSIIFQKYWFTPWITPWKSVLCSMMRDIKRLSKLSNPSHRKLLGLPDTLWDWLGAERECRKPLHFGTKWVNIGLPDILKKRRERDSEWVLMAFYETDWDEFHKKIKQNIPFLLETLWFYMTLLETTFLPNLFHNN